MAVNPHVPADRGTRDRLVDAARELFHRQGYGATSLTRVCELAGANPGSLYHFFRTKERLLAAVLERYLELLGPMVMEPAFGTADDPFEQVLAVLDGYRRMLVENRFSLGCPIGSLALELKDPSPAVQELIARNFAAWRAAIAERLEAAGHRLPLGLNLDRLAGNVLTVMEGGILQARAHHCIEPWDEAVAGLRDHLRRLQTEARRQRVESTT